LTWKSTAAVPHLRVVEESGARTLPAAGVSDEASSEWLVAQLKSGSKEAKAVLFDRYANHILAVLGRLLGNDPELRDVLQDVFMASYSAIHRVREPRALTNWLTQIAVFCARKHIRRKRRQRLFMVFGFDSQAEAAREGVPLEVEDALRATYAVLGKMPTDERIVFALRHIEGMDLAGVATATGVSLATVKRRITRAQLSFRQLARSYPVLREFEDRP